MTTKMHHKLTGLLLIISLGMTPISVVRASGFPVVDIAGIIQSLQDFITQNSQLAEEILQYQQMLTEYQTMLDNLRGYADVDALKADIERMVNDEFNQTLTDLAGLNTNNPNFETQVDIIYEDQWGVPPDQSTVNSTYGSVLTPDSMQKVQASYDKDRAKHKRYKETFQAIARNREKSTERKKDITKYGDRLSNLGPNDQMKAVQLSVAQMNLMLQQMEASIASQDQVLMRTEEEHRQALEERLDERERELKRAKRQSQAVHRDYPMDSWLIQ